MKQTETAITNDDKYPPMDASWQMIWFWWMGGVENTQGTGPRSRSGGFTAPDQKSDRPDD